MPTLKGIARHMRRRRMHAYCIGTAKSGTVSVHRMTSRYMSFHEPDVKRVIELGLAIEQGSAPPDLHRILRWRDRRLWAEMESSNPVVLLAGELAQMYPGAKFLVTARDPSKWWLSQANHMIRFPERRGAWHRYREFCFGGVAPTVHDRPLTERGVYPLPALLARWTRHYETVLERVPPRQVLVVRTRDLANRAGEIAAFLGIPALDLSSAKSNVNPTPALAREDLDAGYVSDQLEQHCGDMMRKLGF